MSRPVIFYFYIVFFIHLWVPLSSFPHVSFDRVEARALLCGSAGKKRIRLYSCVSLSKQSSLPLLKINRHFHVLRSSNGTQSATTSSKAKFVTSFTRKWPTGIIYSGGANICMFDTLVKRFFEKRSASGPSSLDERYPSAVFPWVTPGCSCSTFSRGFTGSASPSKKVNSSTLSLSSPRYSVTTADSNIKGGSTPCLSTRMTCRPSTHLPAKCHPLRLPSTTRESFSLTPSTRFSLALISAATKLCRSPASIPQTRSLSAPLVSTRRSLNIFSPSSERFFCIFTLSSTTARSPFLFPGIPCTRVVRAQRPPLQNTALVCCLHTTPLPLLSPSHILFSSYRPRFNASRCCCWLLQHVCRRHTTKSETFHSTQLKPFYKRHPFGGRGVSCESTKHNSWLAHVNGIRCNGLLRAVLLTGVTRSDSSKNAEIPEFLLPPLFTAVEAADSHHAQSIVAFWKKPGVPRVGWTEDLIEMAREQQRHAARDTVIHSVPELPGREMALDVRDQNKRRGIRTEDLTVESASFPSTSTSAPSLLSATDGVADQGEALLIMTGSSPTHLDTLGEAVVEAMWEKHMRQVLGRDGRGFSGWVALSFMDLEVHIMTPVTRERYALEELYSLCPRIDISDAVRTDKLEGFEFMSGGIERFKPGGPPFDPEVDADYGLYE